MGGIANMGKHYAKKKQNKNIGIIIMLIMFTITYLVPVQGIGWAIKKSREKYMKCILINWEEQ